MSVSLPLQQCTKWTKECTKKSKRSRQKGKSNSCTFEKSPSISWITKESQRSGRIGRETWSWETRQRRKMKWSWRSTWTFSTARRSCFCYGGSWAPSWTFEAQKVKGHLSRIKTCLSNENFEIPDTFILIGPSHRVSAYPELFHNSIVRSISGSPITGIFNLSPHKLTSALSK